MGSENRAFWNATSDVYQSAHGARLAKEALAWGVWRIPEAELNVLGNVRGRDILELGCGAAQWTRALAAAGARAIGLDLSERQLAHAGRAAPLVQANAERLPFAAAAFDIVFCDHGAATFAPPASIVPEVSRVLRAGGLFAFCMSTPFRDVCIDPAEDRVTTTLVEDYFRLGRFDDGESVQYQLPYGAWIRLFRHCGLTPEDLVELQPPSDASTTYDDYAPAAWARQWPAEHIWKLRK